MRLRQRYGIQAYPPDLESLAKLINSHRAVPFCLQQPYTWVIEIRWRGRNIVTVWDDKRKTFKTVLPMRNNRTVEEYLQDLKQYYRW
jgi:hypothetical protein